MAPCRFASYEFKYCRPTRLLQLDRTGTVYCVPYASAPRVTCTALYCNVCALSFRSCVVGGAARGVPVGDHRVEPGGAAAQRPAQRRVGGRRLRGRPSVRIFDVVRSQVSRSRSSIPALHQVNTTGPATASYNAVHIEIIAGVASNLQQLSFC